MPRWTERLCVRNWKPEEFRPGRFQARIWPASQRLPVFRDSASRDRYRSLMPFMSEGSLSGSPTPLVQISLSIWPAACARYSQAEFRWPKLRECA